MSTNPEQVKTLSEVKSLHVSPGAESLCFRVRPAVGASAAAASARRTRPLAQVWRVCPPRSSGCCRNWLCSN